MSKDFYVSLPDWPPQRLVREAVISWGFRHLDGPELNPDTSPWPVLRGVILQFLRHRLSSYDAELRDRAEYDQGFRDSLAGQVAAAAFRKYPWLGQDDPRPFPESDDQPGLLFDEVSRLLADAHGLRDHLLSAIRDLKREGNRQAQIEALELELTQTGARISRAFKFLAEPKHIREESGGKCRAFPWKHSPDHENEYFFFDRKTVTPNRLRYLGFRCPQCQVTVVRLKQVVAFGQGYRMVVFSCYCHTYSVVCPPCGPGTLAPMTLEKWEQICASVKD